MHLPTRRELLISAALCISATGCTNNGQDQLSFPAAQMSFHALNRDCLKEFRAGANDIQKSLAFNACNDRRRQFGSENKLHNWVGVLDSIATDQGASEVRVTISSDAASYGIEFRSSGEGVFGMNAENTIRQGSTVFRQLTAMKPGDLVTFDGSFISDADRGLAEYSLTENGSMEAPTFSIRLEDIRPYYTAVSPTNSVQNAPEADNRGTSIVEVSEPLSEASPVELAAAQEPQRSSEALPPDGLSTLVGMYYLHGKTALRDAGYSPSRDADTHSTVDGDPAHCGNAGCSLPWESTEGSRICVGVSVDDNQEQSRWPITAVDSGDCE